MSNFLINGNQSFGRLTTIFPYREKPAGWNKWVCSCLCGKIHIVRADHLYHHKIRSCGCFAVEIRTTHGFTGSRTYASWGSMKARCSNTKIKRNLEYINRGITVCERWLQFENFLADMGERPEGKSLDRINNNGDYEPNNCRWATPKEQMNNTNVNRRITHQGTSKRLHEWALIAGVSPDTFRTRIRRGWTMERALSNQ